MESSRFLSKFLGVLLLSAAAGANAQQSWIERYEARAQATQAEQPHWATPLVTTNPSLEQRFRTDFVRQSLAGGQTSWNYGNTQGLLFIPARHIEVRFSPPPFLTHSNPKTEDGFGDVGFRMKYRIYGSSEEQHNAIVTLVLPATVPTGKSGNGSCCAAITPTLELGKGFGRLDFVTSAGGALPVTNAVKLGRSIAWNNAIQYRVGRYLWLENEFNSTFYKGGKNDGKEQTFAAPGIIFSRLPLRPGHAGASERLVLTLGAGEQIALTHFNTYNHALLFTSRLRF
jgi:hypothetical protein